MVGGRESLERQEENENRSEMMTKCPHTLDRDETVIAPGRMTTPLPTQELEENALETMRMSLSTHAQGENVNGAGTMKMLRRIHGRRTSL